MEEKVSVIIALYNCEDKITRCIESIENQTYKNIEIIVCDDCSTDNSFEVVKELTKKYDNIILVEKKVKELIEKKEVDDLIEMIRLKKGLTSKQLEEINIIRKENNLLTI